jgi:D-alanyl-lipoteichoic acid acyltransferase DltB (MBOAT superfamily)
MLFNSHVFIFIFLPLTLIGYYGLQRLSSRSQLPMVWLLAVSIFFYGWWEIRYLVLLAVSITANFIAGKMVFRSGARKWWLAAGVTFNLVLLAYFKYAYFLAENFGELLGRNWTIGEITLPLAISFFTFQQITWLVDISRSRATVPSYLRYALFVSFFPQLIAGPIVHHGEMMPQFDRRNTRIATMGHLNIGLTLFTIGLFKKVVLADQFALFATPVFDAAGQGTTLSMLEAWAGTLSYSFQLYFDFSGYSDMAVGLARMVGIVLPLNFFSPYRAANIREFWQRWHITLSRFLRDYLYIPLGGNRASVARVSSNILITMLIGGLWHGAAWTFVAWGGLHGLFLLAHRCFRFLRGESTGHSRMGRMAGVLLTFLAVTLAWVLFRAESFSAAMVVYKGLFGLSGFSVPEGTRALAWIVAGGAICLFAPNAYEFMAAQQPALIPPQIKLRQSLVHWRASIAWAVAFAMLFSWAVLSMNRVSEFLYFQF